MDWKRYERPEDVRVGDEVRMHSLATMAALDAPLTPLQAAEYEASAKREIADHEQTKYAHACRRYDFLTEMVGIECDRSVLARLIERRAKAGMAKRDAWEAAAEAELEACAAEMRLDEMRRTA